ncbi:hypothetical protein SC171_27785 [Pantoea cypripedii]|uniref:hypothetical protein n=1 Tax=Pantoea cypripedii TaxID=55209 RepID=UPI002FCBE870
MNGIPTTSTTSAGRVTADAKENPATQFSRQLTSINNSTENLSSFEMEMQQTLPKEIIARIVRTLHPTEQVEHPLRYLLPAPYSQLLDLSTKRPDIGNFNEIMAIVPFIPQNWQHDAINAICENFIKRIDNFSTFRAVISCILSNKKTDSHSFMLMMQSLIEQVGNFKVNEDFWGADRVLLPAGPTQCRDNAGNIHYEMANLSLLKQSVFDDFELLKLKKSLFIREALKFDWGIKNITSENDENNIRRTPTNEEKSLNIAIKKAKQQINTAIRKKNATDCTALTYKTVYKSLQQGLKENHDKIQNINEIINLFNQKKHNTADIINRHVFEIIIRSLDQNGKVMTTSAQDKIQVQLVNSMEKLTPTQRHAALSCLIKSDFCTPSVLTLLAKKLDSELFEQPHIAMTLIANKMETFYHNKEDVSHVIAALKSYIAPRLEEIRNFLTFFHLISRDCQNILLNNLP